MTITELCKKYKTDKGIVNTTDNPNTWMHGYSLFYDSIFEEHRDSILNILDIGGYGENGGGSSLMWKEYFVNSKIHSFDINEKITTLKNHDVSAHQIDLDNEYELIELYKTLGLKYNIVIEDAKHSETQQVRTFINSINFLQRNSIYIIEDAPHSKNLLQAISQGLKWPHCSDFEYSCIVDFIKDIKIIKTNNVSTLIYIKIK